MIPMKCISRTRVFTCGRPAPVGPRTFAVDVVSSTEGEAVDEKHLCGIDTTGRVCVMMGIVTQLAGVQKAYLSSRNQKNEVEQKRAQY